MYITCPNCNTIFIALQQQIGIGRKVKCSKCLHIWLQKPNYSDIKLSEFNESNKDSITMPIKFAAQPYNKKLLPAVLPPKSSHSKTSIFTWMCLLFFLSILLLEDNFQPLFRYKELKIEDIKIKHIEEDRKIRLSYKIINPTNHIIPLPLIRIRMFDKNQILLNSYISDLSPIEILPQQTLTTEILLDKNNSESETLDVTIHNKFNVYF